MPIISYCPALPVVEEVSARAMYSNHAGSVLDKAGLRQNQELVAPLRAFDRALADKVDGVATNKPSTSDPACATTILLHWADSGALLKQPRSFPAIRERQRFALGINIAVLKLQQKTDTINYQITQWLRLVNTAIIRDFEKRALVDNLYVWSGVNAASFALLDGDQLAKGYQDQVWRKSISQIHLDGYISSELRRQNRALIYHQYYLSGLLLLRKIRMALGFPTEVDDDMALSHLATLVENSLCKPDSMSQASGGFKMDIAPEDQFAIGEIFGSSLLDSRWTKCGIVAKTTDIETLGGDLTQTWELLQNRSARFEIKDKP